MIDERFSSDAFKSCGLDTREARELADLLADEVYKEIHRAIEPRLREIATQLNAMGHNLHMESSSPGDISYPGDIDYRDDGEDEDGYYCNLRLAVNTVVSSGYAHLLPEGHL